MSIQQPSDCPSEFICPLEGRIMTDPVISRQGVSFERSAIVEWIVTMGYDAVCPVTGYLLTLAQLRSNDALRRRIQYWIMAITVDGSGVLFINQEGEGREARAVATATATRSTSSATTSTGSILSSAQAQAERFTEHHRHRHRHQNNAVQRSPTATATDSTTSKPLSSANNLAPYHQQRSSVNHINSFSAEANGDEFFNTCTRTADDDCFYDGHSMKDTLSVLNDVAEILKRPMSFDL